MRNKSILSLAIAASMAISTVSFADAEKPKKPEGDTPAKKPERKPGAGGQGDPAAMIKRLDKNSDNKLSKEEVAAVKRLNDNFAKIDANSDGSIDEAELKANAPKREGKPGEKKPDGAKKPGGEKPKSE